MVKSIVYESVIVVDTEIDVVEDILANLEIDVKSKDESVKIKQTYLSDYYQRY